MAKSRAEIQKAYRERKKSKGSAFLEKERVRQQHNYTPASQLPRRKRMERNLRNKHRNRLSRARVRANRSNEQIPEETSGYESMQSEFEIPGPSRVIVKLPAPQRNVQSIVQLPAPKKNVQSRGIRKVNARARARTSKQIKMMKLDMAKPRKKLKAKNRKIQRMEGKLKWLQPSHAPNATPRKQTDIDISNLNLTPRRSRTIHKKSLLSNAVMSEIEARIYSTTKTRQNIHRVVSGAIAKKYRCLRKINKETGLCRRSMGKVVNKDLVTV